MFVKEDWGDKAVTITRNELLLEITKRALGNREFESAAYIAPLANPFLEEWLRQEKGIPCVFSNKGYPAGNFDVVLVYNCFAYIAEEKSSSVVNKLLNQTNRGIVIVEDSWHNVGCDTGNKLNSLAFTDCINLLYKIWEIASRDRYAGRTLENHYYQWAGNTNRPRHKVALERNMGPYLQELIDYCQEAVSIAQIHRMREEHQMASLVNLLQHRKHPVTPNPIVYSPPVLRAAYIGVEVAVAK